MLNYKTTIKAETNVSVETDINVDQIKQKL